MRERDERNNINITFLGIVCVFFAGLNGQAGTVFCEAKRDGRLPDKNLAGIFVESAKRYSAGFM